MKAGRACVWKQRDEAARHFFIEEAAARGLSLKRMAAAMKPRFAFQNRAMMSDHSRDDDGLLAAKLLSGVIGVLVLLSTSGVAVAGDGAGEYPVLSMDADTARALLPSPPTRNPAEDAPTPQKDYLLLQLIINDAEMEDVVESLQRNGKLYIALGQLSDILDFSIKVDPATKSAKGWFVREQNTLSLSETAGEVKGKSVNIPPGSVFFSDKDLYVDADLLHGWMPLDFTLDLHRMTLGITTREALSFQARKTRAKQHQVLAQQAAVKDQTFRKIDIPYAAAQWPTVDLTASPSYDSTNKNLRTDYSALAVGDFGYLTARFYAAGDVPHDDLSDLRLSFGRDDYEKKLLGFSHASAFRFGDIDSASLSQVATPTQGRGFTMTNRDLDRPDNFDVTNFIGDSKPGWEVELYRNGALIDFQTVGQDGRYAFKSVPILFGNNQFRLAFYGPQGQVEEINKTVNAEASLLEKGQVSYNFSADEKNRSLFGVSDQTGASTPSGFSGVGEMEYGVTKWLTVAGGAAHTVLTDGQHDYTTAGIRASLGSVLASADAAYDATDSTYSTRLSASTDIRNTLLSVQQKFARDFFSEENSTLTTPINRQTVARADRQFGDLGTSLSYTNNAYAGGRTEHLWTNQVSHPFFGNMTFTNTLRHDSDNVGLDTLSGSAFVRGYYKRALLGAQVDYEDKPLRQVDSVKLDALYPFSPAVNDKVTLTSRLSGAKVNTLENTATFDRGTYKLSVTGRANDQGDYFAGLTFNISIGRVPDSGRWIYSSRTLAETGTVAVIPYLDHNYNQLQDAGEGPPPGSLIRVGSHTIKLDKNGTAIASQLTTNTPVSISLDSENQQANPLWTAGVDAYKVVPRPGKIITVPFPVFETSQIDGTVSGPPGASLKDLIVELVNTDGQVVRNVDTAFDGYYLIEGVMPGAYKLRVAADGLAERHLRQDEDRAVTITVSDFFVRDIKLADAGAPATAPMNEGPPAPGEAALAPQSPRRDEEDQAKAEPSPNQAAADGPPMPRVKPEDVTVAPLPDADAGLAKMAQPAAPATPTAVPGAAMRKSLVIVNDPY
jgi:carboxypeptidase family protein